MMNLPPYHNDQPSWRGYTLEEIQMRRALVRARMEIQKFKMSAQYDDMKQRTPFLGGTSSLISRIAGAFSIAEYAYMGLKVVKLIAPMFRKRK
ncbi:MAG: hypothetical protein J1F05_04980 [Muribaculaceae bacterium]|nr:hypothetical protein [Muribaculaceae bacterium]